MICWLIGSSQTLSVSVSCRQCLWPPGASDNHNGECIAGEAPCIATYWVTNFWQLLVLRILTGISLGGCLPLIFSLIGDLYGENERSAVAAMVQIAMGAGMALGQLVAGFAGAWFESHFFVSVFFCTD
jgi:MFS family permease